MLKRIGRISRGWVKVLFFLGVGGIAGLLLLWRVVDIDLPSPPDPGCPHDSPVESGVPEINLWYSSRQVFGFPGKHQEWVNILGSIHSDRPIKSATFSVNRGESQRLNLGPDDRRLACKGDFNVEISYHDLKSGENQVAIQAIDRRGNSSSEIVTLIFTPDEVWPLPYMVDWDVISDPTVAVQIVDGRWSVTDEGIRPETISYDRIIAIGDVSWEYYELRVPFLVHAIDPTKSPSNGAGLGFIMRWMGHNDSPKLCEQPKCGWWNSGATAWYGWDVRGEPTALSLSGYKDVPLAERRDFHLNLDEWYYVKMRLEGSSDELETYRFKIWPLAEEEPDVWLLEGHQVEPGPPHGSLLIVAHHVDATFGDISVVPLP